MGGASDLRTHHPGALLDYHLAGDLGVDQLALDAPGDLAEHESIGLEQVFGLARVLPPAPHLVRRDPHAPVDHALDGVGDLVLPAPRRLELGDHVVNGGAEQVHPHQRQVRGRVLGLLHQADDLAPFVQLGDAELAGVVHGGQQHNAVGAATFIFRHQVSDAAAQQVVAEVHHEGVVAEVVPGGLDRVGQALGLVLDHEGELRAPLVARAESVADLVAGFGADDHADVGDARRHQVLDHVEQVGLVGDGNQLLGAGIRQRAKPRALAAGQDQAFHIACGLPKTS